MWANCAQTRQVLDFHDLPLECPFSQQRSELNQINHLARIRGNLAELYQIDSGRRTNPVLWG